jgi:hypothetical protein
MIVERKQHRRPKRTRSGETLRTTVIAYLAQALPPTAFFSVFPLGGNGLFHGLRMRDLGARQGFPNLLILHDGRAYCIELKSDAGVLQPSQRDCYAALQDARVPVTVARSLEDVQRFLCEECALPMRNWRSAA